MKATIVVETKCLKRNFWLCSKEALHLIIDAKPRAMPAVWRALTAAHGANILRGFI